MMIISALPSSIMIISDGTIWSVTYDHHLRLPFMITIYL